MQQLYKTALISVHPEYVHKILSGTKRVEFRRVWAANPVSHLVLYSTSPEMKIVAILELQEVLRRNKSSLWEVAKLYGGGITRSKLREYFADKSEGYALIIKKVHPLTRPISLIEILPEVRPPQSFLYLTDEQFNKLQEYL